MAIAVLSLFFTSCSKEYLTDGGVSSAVTEYNTYDYLAANKYNMFDTLLMLIDTLDLKETVNTCGTFFAPNDYSIQNYIDFVEDSLKETDEELTYSLSDLIDELEADDLLQYMLTDKVTRGSSETSGEYETLAGNTVSISTQQTTDDQYYVYSDNPVYFLYYTKSGMEDEVCQTSGIMTDSGTGTRLHVLNNDHVFIAFDEDESE